MGKFLSNEQLGTPTATTINKVAITQPANGSTITVADGKTLTISNTLTLTGTDSSSLDCRSGGSLGYIGDDPEDVVIFGDLGSAAFVDAQTLVFTAPPVTVTTSTHTVASNTTWLIVNNPGTCTLTLPIASSYPGRVMTIKTITANTVVSASSNVVPISSSTAGTAILAASAGAWARLVSDGTNWVIMEA